MINPSVTIALATYFPEENYFRKQLRSLNEQTYREIDLVVCDDSADETQFERVSMMIQEEITDFPFRIIKNEQNIGSNKTFERLTLEAAGEFIAYADQDDFWHADKIEKLICLAKEPETTLAYSDLRLIDGDDKVISESMLKSSFRMEHVSGDNAFEYLIENNSVTGCAMLIRSDVAKVAVPFPDAKYYVHDHWLAIAASSRGRLAYSEKALIDYRIHGNNQVGTKRTHDLDTSEKYVKAKISLPLEKLELIDMQFNLGEREKEILQSRVDVLKNRLNLSKRSGVFNLRQIKILTKNSLPLFTFETVLFIFPKFLQNLLLATKNIGVRNLTKMMKKFRS